MLRYYNEFLIRPIWSVWKQGYRQNSWTSWRIINYVSIVLPLKSPWENVLNAVKMDKADDKTF